MKYILFFIPFLYACNSGKVESSQKVSSATTGIYGLQKNVLVANNATSSKTNLLFNPPHGQPGHTCALAVGAPLKQVVQQPQQTFNQAQSKPLVTSNEVSTAKVEGQKLNPKHGEPGHRCDIAVGAPLNSKPTPQKPMAQPMPAKVSNIQVAEGINPPHGQPNHRCDIAVGAPLNSKPVQNTVPAQPGNITPAIESKTVTPENDVKQNTKSLEPEPKR